MTLKLCQIQAHKSYVLRLYRCTIKNLKTNTNSINLQMDVIKVLRSNFKANKINNNSWKIQGLLKDTEELNRSLLKNDLVNVQSLVAKYQIKIVHDSIPKDPKPNIKDSQSSGHVTDMNILARYMKIRQDKGYLPLDITKYAKQHLLLPLAKHLRSQHKLERIRSQLAKGPPKVYLTYTMAGPSRIWFVRSALNKGKHQSKKLGRIIRKEKLRYQIGLDTVGQLKHDARWAILEAQWEEYIVKGTLNQYDLEKCLQAITHRKQNIYNSPVLEKWLLPICDSINIINDEVQKSISHFNDQKEILLKDGGQYDYYLKKSQEVFEKRKQRFDNMMEKEVPYANPFDETQNLDSIMKRYNF